MDMQEMLIQCSSDSRRWFPGTQELPFLVLCLAGEVGEVANLVKKVERGSHVMGSQMTEDVAEEVTDVLIYLCNIMGHPTFADIDWQATWDAKRAKNENRFGRRDNRHD